MGVKVLTDSTAYIPDSLLKKYDISVISLNITLANNSIKEVHISNEEFYELMKKNNKFPKSSQPSLDEITNKFEKNLKNGDDVVAVFISSEMSGTFSSAHLIKEVLLEKYPERKIAIIDSRSNCMQMGLAVLEAAEKAMYGASLEEVVNVCEDIKTKSKFLFTPETLDYLKMGGRIGSAGALVGKVLKIVPILTVLDGKTSVLEKVRTKSKAIEKILSIFLQDLKEKGLGKVIVHHINCEEEGIKLAERIKEKIDINTTVEVISIGPVIGAHVGPGAIGIAYHTKK
ncbi:DegV family protein [Clostridium tarantellae]|uniref:DegV family EDD domain-containing protein n=1 Tax=Clostridium tarantellae TaxID=39493 RepID=A0A6I1MME1_9CLOT|nr:DegV family protein [Clostridium tarantellae]MPQ44140.1 DegV family EDD domain-containing protein [Clostridium tarantellae]